MIEWFFLALPDLPQKKSYLCQSMNCGRKPYQHQKPSTWLLIAALFLGVFAFSGFASNVYSQQKEAPKTELVASIKVTRRAPVLARFLSPFHKEAIICAFRQSEIPVFWFHNRLFKTQVEYPSRQVYNHHPIARLFQKRPSPANSEEVISAAPRG